MRIHSFGWIVLPTKKSLTTKCQIQFGKLWRVLYLKNIATFSKK